MNIVAKTRKSHRWNEDRFIIDDSFYMVIDGATPLIKNEKLNLACWMVKYLKQHINRYNGPVCEKIRKLAHDAYNELGLNTTDPAYLPSAGMAYLEFDDEYYYASILGDCEITFRMKNDEVIRCSSDELTKLDQVAIKQLIEEAHKHNIHVKDARPYIKDILIKHRKLMNTEDGYNVYTILPDSKYEEKKFKIKKAEVKEIYLYTDGFSQAFEYLHIYDSHNKMFSTTLDIDQEINKIVKCAFSDPYCDKFPRFKKIDDITVIKITN